MQAIWEIPKSGEVWCEGARLLMSPRSTKFDLLNAKKFLDFAIYFTPQYGDSFLELLRLFIITKEEAELKKLKRKCIHSEPNYGILWFYFKQNRNDTSLDIWNQAEKQIRKEVNECESDYQIRMSSESTADDILYISNTLYWTGCI